MRVTLTYRAASCSSASTGLVPVHRVSRYYAFVPNGDPLSFGDDQHPLGRDRFATDRPVTPPGGSPLRSRVDAADRGHSRRAHPPLPRSRCGRIIYRDSCDASIIEGAHPRRRTGGASGTRRCTRRRRGTSGSGMKLHIGTPTAGRCSMRATAANVADVSGGAPPAARRGAGGVRRRGLPGRGEAPGAGAVGGRVAGPAARLRRLLEPRSAGAGGASEGVSAGEGGAPLLAVKRRFVLQQGALPRSGQEPGAAGAAAGLDEPAQSRAPTRLTRGAVSARSSKRDGKEKAAPARPRPPPLPSSLSNTTCRRSKSPPPAYLLRGFLAVSNTTPRAPFADPFGRMASSRAPFS